METFAYVLAAFSFLVAVVVGGVLSSKYVSIKDRPLIIAGPLLVGVCCAALPWFMNENHGSSTANSP